MYKKLLVAVDGSDSSLHAFKEALRISKKDVMVLAVAPPYSGDLRVMGSSDLSELIKEPCEVALSQAMDMAEDEGAEIRPVCVMGEPFETIVDVAEALGKGIKVAWDDKTRAYVMTRDSGITTKVGIRIKASKERPIFNPVLVVENWGHDRQGKLLMNNSDIRDKADIRQGVVHRPNGVNALVVWIEGSYREPTHFEIEM